MSYHFGLTGGIGSGKSFVANIFQSMGIPVYISDIRAKALYTEDKVKKSVIKLLGTQAYLGDNVNSTYISEKVFKNKSLLKDLNNIIHPAVASDYEVWREMHHEKPYTLKESAILIEHNLHGDLDGLISVLAPLELRIQRVIKRDQSDRLKILDRILNQTNDETRIMESKYLIINCPSHNLLRQIQRIHHELTQIS